MRLVIFENAYFLQSLGWAIVNSLWQSALLLFLYKLIRLADKKSASFRYNLGLVCLFFSFAWFIVTLMQGYVFFKNESSVSNILINSEYTQQLNKIVSYFSILYLGSLFFYSIRFTKNYINTNALKKNGLVKVPVELRIFISQTALNLGIKNKVQVWLSEHVNVPSVIGFIKPVVLLPIGFCSHLTTEQAEAILLHELAHIKRNDYLINILQSIIELVLFFNPFVRVLNDSIKKERENCCDDYVMNYQYDQYNYANALLILEEQRTNQLAFTMASSNGQMNLLNRIKRLKNLEHNSYSKPLEKTIHDWFKYNSDNEYDCIFTND
ncbi:MAG: M56 family metallopeptidase [Ferruginibacter sp.]